MTCTNGNHKLRLIKSTYRVITDNLMVDTALLRSNFDMTNKLLNSHLIDR